MTRPRWLAVLAVAVLAGGAGAACGSSDGGSSADRATSTTSATGGSTTTTMVTDDIAGDWDATLTVTDAQPVDANIDRAPVHRRLRLALGDCPTEVSRRPKPDVAQSGNAVSYSAQRVAGGSGACVGSAEIERGFDVVSGLPLIQTGPHAFSVALSVVETCPGSGPPQGTISGVVVWTIDSSGVPAALHGDVDLSVTSDLPAIDQPPAGVCSVASNQVTHEQQSFEAVPG